MPSKSAWHQTTPLLFYSVFAFAWGDLMFGIDTGSFGSLQALPSWLRRFGVKQPNGNYLLPSKRSSIINSVVWIGKICGTIIFEPIAERFGYKMTMYFCSFVQIVGIIIEMTAKEWVQFSVGRVLAYLAIGIVENAVPSYSSETAPASVRGFFAGSITVIVSAGNVWGAGMSRAYANELGDKGWLIPTAMQLVPAILIFALVPFAPESPRWLLAHGKKDQAIKVLDRLRTQADVDAGLTLMEANALEQAIEESRNVKEGRWSDLLRKPYRRRTQISAHLFAFNQLTGNQFVNSYGPTFYKSIGLGALSFTYAVVGQTVAIVASLIGILTTDKVGRRPLLIGGTIGAVLFNCIVAGLGSKKSVTKAEINTVVASLILLLSSNKISFQVNSFLMVSEIGGVQMRKKFMSFGTSVDVLAAFIVTFCTPYVLGNPSYLGPKVGWIFAGISGYALLVVIFLIPELRGRSLEEMDELFAMNLWAWQFSKAKTSGIGATITQIEGGKGAVDPKYEHEEKAQEAHQETA